MRLAQRDWPTFRELVEQKGLFIYENRDNEECYILEAYDAPFMIECYICKTREDDVADYEENYKNDPTKCFSGGYIED